MCAKYFFKTNKGSSFEIVKSFRLIFFSQLSHAPYVPSLILKSASSINLSSFRSRLVSWNIISLPSRLEARSISLLKVRSPTSLSRDFEDCIKFNSSLLLPSNRSLIFKVSPRSRRHKDGQLVIPRIKQINKTQTRNR